MLVSLSVLNSDLYEERRICDSGVNCFFGRVRERLIHLEVVQDIFDNLSAPATQHRVQQKLEVGTEARMAHVIRVELVLGRKNPSMVVAIKLISGDIRKKFFFTCEGIRSSTCNAGAPGEISNLVFGQLRSRPNQAHVASEYVDELRQLIEFPSAKKRTYRSKPLIVCRGD